MADIVTLTHQPIRQLTTTGTLQPIYLAADIGGYDFLDMQAGLLGIEGAVSAFTLELWTGMQAQTDDGWAKVGATLLSTTTPGTWGAVNYPNGLLRYLRWRAVVTGGTAATFFIRGMARRYA